MECCDHVWNGGEGGRAEGWGILQSPRHSMSGSDCYPQTCWRSEEVMPLSVSEHLLPNFDSVALLLLGKAAYSTGQLPV